jgi:protein-tyrosine phosphatase
MGILPTPDLSHLHALDEIEVMMVCLGNICRSPMAAAVLATRAREIDRKRIIVTSSGTSSWHTGQGPNPPSKRVWERAGYSYDHSASQISAERIQNSDLVLVMDSSNHSDVLAIADPKNHSKIFYLREFDFVQNDLQNDLKNELEVPDPYGLGDDAFERVLEMVERSVDGLLNALGVAAPSDTSR